MGALRLVENDDILGINGPEAISDSDRSNFLAAAHQLQVARAVFEEARLGLIKAEGAYEFMDAMLRNRYELTENDTIDSGGIINRA